MQNLPVPERRAYSRFEVDIPLAYCVSAQDKAVGAVTHDISAEGLCIETNEELPTDTCLGLYLQMPDNKEEINRSGKVIWSAKIASDKFRLGIKLLEQKLKPILLTLRTIKTRRKY